MDQPIFPPLTDVQPSARAFDLLVRTGLALAQERDLRNIVQAATDAGRELCGAEFGAFFYNVIHPSGESYRLYTLSGVPREAFSRFPDPRNTVLFLPTFTGQCIIRSSDVTNDPRYGLNAPYAGMPPGHLPVRSYLAVPVISRTGEVRGALLYGHSEPGVFREDSEALVQTIAAQAAVAIENFRLHEELNHRIQDADSARTEQIKEGRRVLEVLESTSDAVLFLDRDWVCRFANGHAIRLIARDRELLGNNIWQVFPEAVGSLFQREYEIVMRDRQPREFVEFFPPLDRWFAIRAYPAQEGISIFFHDVTKVREAERASDENARRLRLALDAGQLGTWTWSAATDLLDLDERAAELFDWHPHVPITRSALRERVVHADDRRPAADALRQSLEAGGSYTSQYRVQRQDGSVSWILAYGVPILEGDPTRLAGMIGTVQDITAARLREQTLLQTEKLAATGRLAATIAHEINNPLEAVANLIYLARTAPETSASVRAQLEIADDELRRVSLIAQQTLGFYRDTSQPTPFDLAEAARDVAAIFHRKLQARQIDCRVDAPDPIRFRGLQGEIRQAIANLLVNAIDASPSPGAILLRVRAAVMPSGDPAVSILVCDRGPGIPAPVRGSLFAPFFTTKRQIGTGLGLWVTRGIVEKHEGTVRFRTRTANPTGTVFRILLPHPEPAATRS